MPLRTRHHQESDSRDHDGDGAECEQSSPAQYVQEHRNDHQERDQGAPRIREDQQPTGHRSQQRKRDALGCGGHLDGKSDEQRKQQQQVGSKLVGVPKCGLRPDDCAAGQSGRRALNVQQSANHVRRAWDDTKPTGNQDNEPSA